MFQRQQGRVLGRRLTEPRRFMQVLHGPRQCGKTTLARQAMDAASMPAHYATADEPALKGLDWLEQQWEVGRNLTVGADPVPRPALLILDEIQKIAGWSELVKRLWDEDTARDVPLHVVLLGSSALLVQSGLSESLAGRYEVIRVTHWSYPEMHAAFGIDTDHFVRFGGYPGAAPLMGEFDRWKRYVLDSLIEPAISRDILLMTRVDKPALLRRVFELGCAWSGQILSFQKMLGQLHDAGNTTTLSHYLGLLEGAGLVAGLQKYSARVPRRRGSSPKLLALNTALMTAVSSPPDPGSRAASEFRGRLVETAVGASLYNRLLGTDVELFYWADRDREVDFVLRRGTELVAIEVKSGRGGRPQPGMAAFCARHDVRRKLLVGGDGIALERFFLTEPHEWFDDPAG